MFSRLLALFFILLAPLLTASSKDIAISDIEVMIPTKKQKKDPFPQAVDIGKKEAFEKMLLGYSRELIDKNIKGEEIGDLISKVQVLRQFKTKTVYRAKLIYFFNRQKVDQFIQAKTKHLDMPHVLPKTTLLIPVTAKPDGTYMVWEDDSPWRQAWLKQSADLPVIMPLGDLEDRRLLSVNMVKELDRGKLEKILKKYHCTSCIIPMAKLNSMTGQEHSGDFVLKAAQKEEIAELTQISLTADSKEALITQALESLEPEVKKAADVKAEIPMPQGHMTALRVSVPFNNPGEYYKIEDCLKKIGLIHHIETESIALDEAKLNLFCFGNKESLQKALAEQELLLQEIQNKLKIVSKPRQEFTEPEPEAMSLEDMLPAEGIVSEQKEAKDEGIL